MSHSRDDRFGHQAWSRSHAANKPSGPGRGAEFLFQNVMVIKTNRPLGDGQRRKGLPVTASASVSAPLWVAVARPGLHLPCRTVF